MKKLLMLTVLLGCMVMTGCDSVKTNETDEESSMIVENKEEKSDLTDVGAYNDALIDIVDWDCLDAESQFLKAIENIEGDTAKVFDTLDQALATCEKSLLDVQAMTSYEGDDSLRSSIEKYLDAEVEYLEMWDQLFTSENEEEMDVLGSEIDRMEEQTDLLRKEVIQVQEAFASKFGYELQ